MVEKYRHFVRPERITPPAELGERILSSVLKIEKLLNGNQTVTISEGAKTLTLNNFLPDEVWFHGADGEEFAYSPPDIGHGRAKYKWHPHVVFDTLQINTLQGRMALLHEMGHAIDLCPLEENMVDRYPINRAYMLWRDIRIEAGYANGDPRFRTSDFLQEFKKRWDAEDTRRESEGEYRLPFEKLVKSIDGVVREERAAWAEALKLYRRIKQEHDFDILDGATVKEIRSAAENNALCVYEQFQGILLSLANK